MPSEISEGSEPEWDQEDADGLVGQLELAGFTYVAADGKTVEGKVQCFGRIVSVTPEGISVVCEGKQWSGETMTLPAELDAFESATPGQYTLSSTGETVDNPDLTTSWTITEALSS
jgi:hypothetical protein